MRKPLRYTSTLAVLTGLVALLCLLVISAMSAPALAATGEGCPNEQVRSESSINPATGQPYSMGLPECRAYEMVSPLEKGGNNVTIGIPQQSAAAPAGGAVTYTSLAAFAGAQGGSAVGENNNYLSVRDYAGWVTSAEFLPVAIAPVTNESSGEQGLNFTPDLSMMVMCGGTGEAARLPEPAVVCGLHEADGSWLASPVLRDTTVVADSATNSFLINGASSDLSHIVFILDQGPKLLASDTEEGVGEATIGGGGATQAGSGIYELAGLGTGSTVVLRLVNVDNSGVEIGTGPPLLGNSRGALHNATAYHAISESGERVFFGDTPVGGVQTVYARVGGAYTVAISEPTTVECSECQTSSSVQGAPGDKGAEFQGASADGSKVFFTTEQELLAGHTGKNLYEYDFEAPVGDRIMLVSGGSAKAEVQGVLRNSGDGSHEYFVARGVLTSARNAVGQEAQAGADNLYVFERDAAYPAGRVSFIAMLCSGREVSGAVGDARCPSSSSDASLWADIDEGRLEDITPDGDYLVFDTYAHLLSQDTNEALAVYRYDALTGELAWVSHAAPGFTAGNAGKGEGDSATIPALFGSRIGALSDVEDIARSVSEDGSDIVFSTTEKLQADDVNSANDVYLWHDGTVSMISDGQDLNGADASQGGISSESAVISGSGSNIFFTTRTSLVGQDIDSYADVYDARLDGGFLAPVAPLECGQQQSGEACQGALSGLPSFGASASSVFTGGANLTPPVSKPPPVAKPKAKPLTRAQKLARALKACKAKPKRQRRSSKQQRRSCEARARRRYGAKAKAKSKAGRRGSR